MKKKLMGVIITLLMLFMAVGLSACNKTEGSADNTKGKITENVTESTSDNKKNNSSEEATRISKDGSYTSMEEVSLYIYTYGDLPNNYITKSEARSLGWDSSKGNLREVAPGKSIGGDRFDNREGKLPQKNNRQYYECDIDYTGGRRNGKRIIYSNDGAIYYTSDHYSTFRQLY